MTETAARAQRIELPAFSAPYYIWEPANKPMSVAIPMQMIEELEREAVESFRCLTSRGSEIGGVLFGTPTPGSPAQLVLVSYELIPCEYARGPLYRLAEADLNLMDRVIAEAAGAGHTVAGFFRSNTRKSLAIDADDRTVLETRFGAPYNVALLIRPLAAKPSTGAMFIREEGAFAADSSPLEFPFRPDQLKASTPRPAQETPKAAARPAQEAQKTAPRAQIVPIASRRDPAPIELPSAPPAAVPPVATAVPAAAASPAAAPKAQAAPAAPAKPVAAATPKNPPVQAVKPAAPAQTVKVVTPAPTKTAPAAPAKPAPIAAEEKKAEEKKTEDRKDEKKKVSAPAATPKPEPVAQSADEAEKSETGGEEIAAVSGSSNKKLYTFGGLAAAVVIAAGLFVTPAVLRRSGLSRGATAGLADGSLTLRVERSGGELLLTWNRDSQAIRSASRAVLQINDGPQHDNVEMDLAQLRNGSIVYSPVTSDVVFKMEVTGANGAASASESVRVLSSRPSPLTAEGALPPQQALPKTPAAAQAAAAAGDENAEEAKPVTQPRTLKAFNTQSLAQRLRPSTSADLTDAGVAENATAPVSVSGLNLGTASAPPLPAPPVQVSAPPAAAPATKTGGQIQPAELIKRRDPEFPKLARDAGAKGMVQLLATVGTDGHVKAVKIVKGHPLLVRAASDAVMQWIYRPTILNGVAVETTTEVTLNFVNER